MLHAEYGFDLLWIRLNPPLSDHESQKFCRGDPEGALGGIQFHSVLPESRKSFLQIFDVLFCFGAFD